MGNRRTCTTAVNQEDADITSSLATVSYLGKHGHQGVTGQARIATPQVPTRIARYRFDLDTAANKANPDQHQQRL